MAKPMKRERRGFTLLEVLVAVGALGVGITGVLSAMSAGLRAAGQAEQLKDAVRLAQNELELAAGTPAEQMQPRSGTAGRCRWTLTYADKPHGLVLATVVVEWTEWGKPREYRLSQLLLPGS